jgi:hypothetical protein
MNLNESHLKSYQTRLQEISRIVDSELMPLTELQLNWKPAPSSWSVAECIEHLLLAFDGYIKGLATIIEKGNNENVIAKSTYKISLAGKLMVFAVDPSIKIPIPAPPKFKPEKHKTYTHEVLRNFQNTIHLISSQLEAGKSLDWNLLKITSPVTSLLKLTMGDTFEVLTLHALRHLKQAQKVMLNDKFPV